MKHQNMYTRQRGHYTISTDPSLLDRDAIAAALSRMYWSEGRQREVIERSLDHSLCFGLYHDHKQVGLARVITDYATFAYLCDVYVLEAHRGQALGKWLVEAVVTHPELASLRRVVLVTRDAHDLYRQYGFAALDVPENWMEIFRR